jgi:DNA-binding NtrC family response regulator
VTPETSIRLRWTEAAVEVLRIGDWGWRKEMSTALHDIHFMRNESEFHEQDLPLLIGQSREMAAIRQKIRRLSGENTNVLLTGERGCGMERIARTIHFHSPRSKGPLVRISGGALSFDLFEKKAFGIQVAQGGTLFIDDIDALPLSFQVNLARVFEEKGCSRGGRTCEDTSVKRVFAATARDLGRMVEEGSFKKDLYDGLNLTHIRVSPLREKEEDILLLAEHFLHMYCSELNKAVLHIPDHVSDFLATYHWPGNVGELESVIQRTVALGEWGIPFEEPMPGSPRWLPGGNSGPPAAPTPWQADPLN